VNDVLPKKPSRWFYLLGAMIAIAGLAFFIFTLVSFFGVLFKGFENSHQFAVPGGDEFTLSEAGRYTVYYEYESVLGNKVYRTGEKLPLIEVFLKNKQTGKKIDITSSAASQTYSMGSRSGIAMFDFIAKLPGEYKLYAKYAEGRSGPEIVLSVQKGFDDFVGGIFKTIALSFVILFGSFAIAALIIIFTLIKRSDSFKKGIDQAKAPLKS